MSNQSPAYPHPEYASRHPHGRAQSAGAVSRHVQRAHGQRAGYTLTHGGRQVRVGPVAFWIVVGTLVIMAVWSIGTGTYFAFREDVLTRLIVRQADMQFAYEDRIAELRAQVDRITGKSFATRSEVLARHGMVCTSVPLATQVGLDILRRGGSAIDAAIAANATLGLMEPVSNGVGERIAREAAPQNSRSPRPASIAPGHTRIVRVSSSSIVAMLSVSDAKASGSAARSVIPDRSSGSIVSE